MSDGRRIANRALLVSAAVYIGYGLLGLAGIPGDFRYLALIAAFYFVPSLMLRGDPDRQRRYQVGPGSVIPPWRWKGARLALILVVAIFPPFCVAFFWFYSKVCLGDLMLVSPVTAIEGLTPAAGGLESYLERLCRPHNGALWPNTIKLPADWLDYGGFGAVLAIAIEVFAVALPEEVFHRGYLMSALEERWPAKRKILGAPLGVAAILASLIFAVGHLVGMAELARLATFFPALLFAWLWRKSGSLWAPALFHAAANLLMAVLIASTFPS